MTAAAAAAAAAAAVAAVQSVAAVKDRENGVKKVLVPVFAATHSEMALRSVLLANSNRKTKCRNFQCISRNVKM